MRIGRTIIIQAILTLGAAGSIAASVAVPAATVAAPSAHVHTVAVSRFPTPGITCDPTHHRPNGLLPIQ